VEIYPATADWSGERETIERGGKDLENAWTQDYGENL